MVLGVVDEIDGAVVDEIPPEALLPYQSSVLPIFACALTITGPVFWHTKTLGVICGDTPQLITNLICFVVTVPYLLEITHLYRPTSFRVTPFIINSVSFITNRLLTEIKISSLYHLYVNESNPFLDPSW